MWLFAIFRGIRPSGEDYDASVEAQGTPWQRQATSGVNHDGGDIVREEKRRMR